MSIEDYADRAWHLYNPTADSEDWTILKTMNAEQYGIVMDLYKRGFLEGFKLKLTGVHDGDTL